MPCLPAARINDPTTHGAAAAGAAVGALGGAVAGAAIGAAVGGPVGAVVGAVAGAVIGGIAGFLLGGMEGKVLSGFPSVLIGGPLAARVSDGHKCGLFYHSDSTIATGSLTVAIGMQMAGRVKSKAVCDAKVKTGEDTVLIGGPTAGGNPIAGTEACKAAAATRPVGQTYPAGDARAGQVISADGAGQSYNNCGIESSRQIINRVRANQDPAQAPISEDALYNETMANGDATQVPNDRWASGGTLPSQRQRILARNGVSSSREAPTMENLESAILERRGVMIDVYASEVWPAATATASGIPPGSRSGGHSILVTGVIYDDDGNLESVIVNDTGIAACGRVIPAATLENGLMGGGNTHGVTNDPIW